MTAEAHSTTAQPDPARSPAEAAHPPGQHRRTGHTSCSPRPLGRTAANPVRDDPMVNELVARARSGNKQAWDALVDRYSPLIWSICRRHRLGDTDAQDVGQNVWMLLVDHLDRIRNPAALPGWLATTTRRECLRVLRETRVLQAAGHVPDAGNLPDEQAETAEQELLEAERHAALREAFMDLPPSGQRLIALLIEDPPVPYAEISARLGIPVGSIGPTRARYLAKLRRHPAFAALIDTDSSVSPGSGSPPPIRASRPISARRYVLDRSSEQPIPPPAPGCGRRQGAVSSLAESSLRPASLAPGGVSSQPSCA